VTLPNSRGGVWIFFQDIYQLHEILRGDDLFQQQNDSFELMRVDAVREFLCRVGGLVALLELMGEDQELNTHAY